jgi:hypothetical protein
VRPGRNADHSPPSRAKVNDKLYLYLFPLPLVPAWGSGTPILSYFLLYSFVIDVLYKLYVVACVGCLHVLARCVVGSMAFVLE